MTYQEALNTLHQGNISEYRQFLSRMDRTDLAEYCHWLYFQGSSQNSKILIARAFQHNKLALELKRA